MQTIFNTVFIYVQNHGKQMAEQVTGSIGQEQVVLNNAASESTLRLILEGIRASSTNSASAIDKMAAKAGIDSKTIEAANTEVSKSTAGFKNLKGATDSVVPSFNTLVETTEKLVKGTAQSSDLISAAFSKTSGIVSLFGQGLLKLAQFQEETLASYRSLSQSGVNFGGSLTDLRMAAASSYMTLGDFTTMLKNNSQSLLNLGGSVNGGAVAFAKFSHSVLSSELGDQLLALGYTTDEANQSMLTYLGAAGISNAKDLQTNTALRDGAVQYLNEMDRLAQVTGRSRQEQEETMKKQKLDAEIQITASRMKDPVARAAFEANVKYMSEQFGAAGKDMALAQAQGRSVITQEGKTLSAIAPNMQQAYQKMVQAGNQYGVGTAQYIAAQNEMLLAAKKGVDSIPTVVFSANDSIKNGLGQTLLTVSKMTEQGLDSTEKLNERDQKVADDKALREKSQAENAAKTEKSLKDLGQSVLAALLPIIKVLLPILNGVVQGFASLIEKMLGLKTIVIALTAAFIAYKGIQSAVWGAEKIKQISTGGIAEAFKKTSIGQLGTKLNPMYVIVVGGGGGGLGDLLDGKKGKKSPKTGPGTPANREARIAKVQSGGIDRTIAKVQGGGIAQPAMKGLSVATKGAGIVGSLVSIAMMAKDIADINKKQETGEITKEEASKQKGGAVGEGVGGLAGAAAGAATGALIGSVVPVIGTAIGGVVGGIIGGFGGGWFGKKAGESVMGPSKPPKVTQPESPKVTQPESPKITQPEPPKIIQPEPPKIIQPDRPQLADGGIVTRATAITAGESGPEAIIPLAKFEKLQTELATLNTSMREVVRYMKDTADNTKKNIDATRALNGNLFSA